MRLNVIFLLLAGLAMGCASMPPPNLPHPAREFPADAFITQRGILTSLGRQYSLNGYLSRSAIGGQRLVVTENFGSVLGDVLLKPDGTVRVMNAGKILKPKWVEHFVAGDLACIFGGGKETNCPGRMISPTHFVIQRRWYKLDLQIVDIKAGPQSPTLFEDKPTKTP